MQKGTIEPSVAVQGRQKCPHIFSKNCFVFVQLQAVNGHTMVTFFEVAAEIFARAWKECRRPGRHSALRAAVGSSPARAPPDRRHGATDVPRTGRFEWVPCVPFDPLPRTSRTHKCIKLEKISALNPKAQLTSATSHSFTSSPSEGHAMWTI